MYLFSVFYVSAVCVFYTKSVMVGDNYFFDYEWLGSKIKAYESVSAVSIFYTKTVMVGDKYFNYVWLCSKIKAFILINTYLVPIKASIIC